MSMLLVLPVVIPLAGAIASLLSWSEMRLQRRIVVASTALQLLAGFALLAQVWQNGVQAVQLGSWAAPFGITFVADHLSAAMVVITGVIGFSVTLYALGTIDRGRERFGFYPLYNLLLMAVAGAFLTGDIFNLYVWFEVMLITSFALLVLGNAREQIRGGLTYVAINLVSSTVFLAAVGLLYGATGTLNMADLAVRLPDVASPGLVTTLATLFLIVFGVKAAVFPLFFWLPASYHAPPVAVSAVFAGLLTKVGVYALLRVFTLLFTQDVPYTHGIILGISAATMVTGVLGAAAQSEVRRILSFHIVSQIGYMIMGLGLFTRLALAGSVFYVLHHIVVKTNLFLISGLIRRIGGSFELDRVGGLYRSNPYLAILFIIPAFSLAGLPPLSGFWAKLYLVRAGLEAEEYWMVFVALAVGVLTLYSMTKIWGGAFWKPAPADAPDHAAAGKTPRRILAPVVGLAAITLAIGLWAWPLAELSTRAATELLEPQRYLDAVLEARR
jgi:multicomponent Na+:H+ antiporter subunit D